MLNPEMNEDQVTEEIWSVSNRTENRKAYQFIYTNDLDKEIECLIINNGNKDGYIPINWIEGFVYEKGYTYKIAVSIVHHANPLPDSGNKTYKLKRLIHKE